MAQVPRKDLDPPDNRPVYVVVFEGDFRTRAYGRRGCWLAIDVTPAFGVRGFRLAPPEAKRIVNLDLNELGRVHSIDLGGRSDT